MIQYPRQSCGHCYINFEVRKPIELVGVWIQWNEMVDWNAGMDWNDGLEHQINWVAALQ